MGPNLSPRVCWSFILGTHAGEGFVNFFHRRNDFFYSDLMPLLGCRDFKLIRFIGSARCSSRNYVSAVEAEGAHSSTFRGFRQSNQLDLNLSKRSSSFLLLPFFPLKLNEEIIVTLIRFEMYSIYKSLDGSIELCFLFLRMYVRR